MADGHATGDSDESKPKEDPAAIARRLENGFRSQQLWDATMGASVVKALRSGSRPVILLIGQFHSDFNGGTVQQIRARASHARILVISMQREDSTMLRDEDRDRADIIIYTGPRPPDEEDDDGVEQTADDADPAPSADGVSLPATEPNSDDRT